MSKKRFVAGVTCPKCNARDTIMMYRNGDHDYRECVDCGFRDRLRFRPSARELTTRVNQKEGDQGADTQVIQIRPLNDDQ